MFVKFYLPILFGKHKQPKDRSTDDLEGVNKWMKDNKLKLNVKKTQLIVLSKKRRACELENVEVKLEGRV